MLRTDTTVYCSRGNVYTSLERTWNPSPHSSTYHNAPVSYQVAWLEGDTFENKTDGTNMWVTSLAVMPDLSHIVALGFRAQPLSPPVPHVGATSPSDPYMTAYNFTARQLESYALFDRKHRPPIYRNQPLLCRE
jgi:hypothetical protein